MSDTAKCPACEADLETDEEVEVGDSADCDSCGAALLVVGLDPLIFAEEEDDDDYEEDDDEDDEDQDFEDLEGDEEEDEDDE